MFFEVLANMAAISIGVVLLCSWVAFVSEAIARLTHRKRPVPYPDEVLWARFGRSLLDVGLFGGEPVWTRRPERALPEDGQRSGEAKEDQAGRCATRTPGRGRTGCHGPRSSAPNEPEPVSCVAGRAGQGGSVYE